MSAIADVRIPMRPLTVEDYERMVDAGILTEDDRVELLNGQLAETSPMRPEHAAITQWLATRLIRGIDPALASVRVQSPMRLPPLSEPEPDIAIVAPGVYVRAHPREAMLVIEIALSSRLLDLGAKAEIYAAAGVPEYWVVDIAARAVHVHDSPRGARYGSYREVTGGSLRPAAIGVPVIELEALFGLLG